MMRALPTPALWSARRRLTRLLAAASVLATSACEGLFDSTTVCTLGASAAIHVFVRDAVTGAPIPPDGTTLILRDGAFVDSTTWPQPWGTWPEGVPLYTSQAFERPGTYDVTVRQAAYVQWDTTRIRVREGECGVRTVTLTARLRSLAVAP